MSYNYYDEDVYAGTWTSGTSPSTSGTVDVEVPLIGSYGGGVTLVASLVSEPTTTIVADGWTQVFYQDNGDVALSVLSKKVNGKHEAGTYSFEAGSGISWASVSAYRYVGDPLSFGVDTPDGTSGLSAPALNSPSLDQFCKVLYIGVFRKVGWSYENHLFPYGSGFYSRVNYGYYDGTYGWAFSVSERHQFINDSDGDPIGYSSPGSGEGVIATVAFPFTNPQMPDLGDMEGFSEGSVYNSTSGLALTVTNEHSLNKALEIALEEVSEGVQYPTSISFGKVLHKGASIMILPDPNDP